MLIQNMYRCMKLLGISDVQANHLTLESPYKQWE